jgi:hypothetical protein
MSEALPVLRGKTTQYQVSSSTGCTYNEIPAHKTPRKKYKGTISSDNLFCH